MQPVTPSSRPDPLTVAASTLGMVIGAFIFGQIAVALVSLLIVQGSPEYLGWSIGSVLALAALFLAGLSNQLGRDLRGERLSLDLVRSRALLCLGLQGAPRLLAFVASVVLQQRWINLPAAAMTVLGMAVTFGWVKLALQRLRQAAHPPVVVPSSGVGREPAFGLDADGDGTPWTTGPQGSGGGAPGGGVGPFGTYLHPPGVDTE